MQFQSIPSIKLLLIKPPLINGLNSPLTKWIFYWHDSISLSLSDIVDHKSYRNNWFNIGLRVWDELEWNGMGFGGVFLGKGCFGRPPSAAGGRYVRVIKRSTVWLSIIQEASNDMIHSMGIPVVSQSSAPTWHHPQIARNRTHQSSVSFGQVHPMLTCTPSSQLVSDEWQRLWKGFKQLFDKQMNFQKEFCFFNYLKNN